MVKVPYRSDPQSPQESPCIHYYFVTLPPYLIFQLSRSNRWSSTDFTFVNSRLVVYPVNGLNMQPFVHPTIKMNSNEYLYDLIAVCCCSVSNAREQYYSICRCRVGPNNRWLMYNDHVVQQVDESSVVSPFAYLLVYSQRKYTYY